MREILFKAKRIDNGEWVKGSLFAEGKITKIIRGTCNTIGIEGVDVNPETICQCTGLEDNHGKLIWENDILSIGKKMDSIGNYYHPPVKYPTNVLVRWDLCAWLWETISKNKNEKHYIGFPDAWCHYEAEVIGNIFDNPELMHE